MNKINIPSVFLLLLIIQSCAMTNEQDIDTKQFKELDRHAGSENYEVVEVVPKVNLAKYFYLDTIANKLIINSYYKSLNKEKNTYDALKFDVLGNIEATYDTHTILNDGTMWNNWHYSNWVVNGDTTKYKYIDPLSNNEIADPFEYDWKETDFEKWFANFKPLYEKADYIRIFHSFYYFKIDNKWYLLKANLKGTPIDFIDQYPPKEEDDVRMIEPKNLAPFWYRKAAKEDTSPLIKMVGYESTYFEEVDKGAFSYGYSAGWWYLEIYMPLGDTLRIKRYSDYQDPKLQLYKIPPGIGGRNDVLFIVQRPEEIFPFQVGGMYVIRPRDPNQPEMRYKRYSTVRHPDGRVEVLRAEETEAYKKWKMKE